MKSEEISNIEKGREKKYSLAEGDIIEVGENSELLKKMPGAMQKLPWPVEIQGGGHSYRENKKFKIWYPEGDIFLSLSTVIHELGHLRQADIDENLDPEKDMGEDMREHYLSNLVREKDAITRGWERAVKHCPDLLSEIQQKFQKSKTEGKFEDFENFEAFYKYVQGIMILINEFYKEYGLSRDAEDRRKILKENSDISKDELEERIKEIAGEYVAGMIKKSKASDFFVKIDKMRTGEKLNKYFARAFIKKIAVEVAAENYK